MARFLSFLVAEARLMRNVARVAKDGFWGARPRNTNKSTDRGFTGPRLVPPMVTRSRRSRVGSLTPVSPSARDVAPPVDLVVAAAHAASANVGLAADSLRGAARALERADWKRGRCMLSQGTTTVRTLVLVTDMLASIPGLDQARRATLDVVLTCVRATLSAIESKRRRGDWDGVRSVLDRDMDGLLQDWSQDLMALAEEVGAGVVAATGDSDFDDVSAHPVEVH
jgi:hypothetical protein